jgi:hypothetical protein
MPANPTTGRAALPRLMKQAREVASKGLCLGFKDVCAAMGEEGKTLRLWASASERDEIDRICSKAREPIRRR